MYRARVLLVLTAILAVILTGCSSKSEPKPASASPSATTSSSSASSSAAPADTTASGSPSPSSSADTVAPRPSVMLTQAPAQDRVYNGDKGFTFKGVARNFRLNDGLLMLDRDPDGAFYVTDPTIRTSHGNSSFTFRIFDGPIGADGDTHSLMQVWFVAGPKMLLDKWLVHNPRMNPAGDVVLTRGDLRRAHARKVASAKFYVTNVG
jgi:hypothetical protein